MVSRSKIFIIISLGLFLSSLVAATATSVTLDGSIVQSGTNISVNVTADQSNDDVYAILDNNSNGAYDSSTDLITNGSINNSDSSETIGYFDDTSSIQEGDYTVYAVQQGSAPSDGDSVSGQASTQIEFDNTAPNISDYQAEKLNFYSANVSFKSNETLETARIEDGSLSIKEFLEDMNKNSSSAPTIYWKVVKVKLEGSTTISLANAADAAGNDGSSDEEETLNFDPIVNDFSLLEANGYPKVEIVSYDQLSSINVSLARNASGYLGLSDFSESENNGQYTYTANLTNADDGTINATLLEATNSTGQDGAWNQTDEQSFQIPPTIEQFYLDVSNQDVTLHVDANENLAMLDASYDGTVSSGELDYSNFTESTNNGFYNYTVDIPSGEEGTYNATLNFAEDDSGNRNSTELIDEIVVDSTPPTISEYSVNNPTNNEVNISFNSSEELDAITVTGSGMESFTLTESDFSTSQTEAPYEYYAIYNAENEGDLTVSLDEAKDPSGNDGASGTNLGITVTYPPAIHEFDLFANDQDVDLEVNVSEELNNLTVDLSQDVSGTLNMTNFTETTPDSYYIYTADISDGTEGEFEATLQTANDTQGLDGAAGESDYLILDNTPPPDPNTTNIAESQITGSNEETVTVEVNFTSSTETGDLQVRFNNSNGDTLVKNKSVSSTDQLQIFDFDLTSLSDGEVWAESRMVDEAGNINDAGYTTNSSNVTKDTTAPEMNQVITGDSLSGGSDARDKITVEFSDDVGLDTSTVHNSDFTITQDSEVKSVDSILVEDSTVTITLEEDIPTGGNVNVEVVNIADGFGNSIESTKEVIADDGLNPQITSAVVDSAESTETETHIEITFSESVITDGHSVTINSKSVNFASDSTSAEKHTVNYGEVLDTGMKPNVTSVTGVDDGNGNNAAVENGKVTVNSFKRDLSQGKNLVSFPIEDQTTYSINELLPENKINSVWAYYNGEWKIYNPGAENNDFNQIKGGYGYIVDAKEDFTIAPNVNTDTINEVAEYPVDEGWNLVGQPQEYNQVADSGDAFNSNINVEQVYKKASSSFDYTRIDPDATFSEDMEPGNAYWMKSGDGDTILTPNFAVSQSNIVIDLVGGIMDFFRNLFGFVAEVIG